MTYNNRSYDETVTPSTDVSLARGVRPVLPRYLFFLGTATIGGPLVAGGSTPADDVTDADPVVSTGTFEESVDDDTPLDNTTDSTADLGDGDLLNETTDSLNETTTNTTDTVEDTTDEVDDTVENTTDAVENTTGVDVDSDTNATNTDSLDANATSEDDPETTDVEADDDTVERSTAPESTDGATVTATDSADGAASGAGDDAATTRGGASTPATGDGTTTEAAVAGAGTDRSNGDGSGISPDPGLTMGALVAGAAGAGLLSRSLSTSAQQPRVLQAGALQARSVATGARGWLGILGDKVWKLAAVLRYSQWDDSDPLEHEGRTEVYDAVEDSPGIYLSALEERTDGSLSSLRYHLRILESEGLITTEKVRGKRRYFPVERDPADPELVAALDDPATEAILTTLAEEGPASGGDISEALDRDPSTISHHLSRLEDDGLVVRERDGRAVVNRLSDTAAVALREDALASGEDRPAVADD
jgi:DNA-binding transcriptional ArsR family regulator